MTKRFTIKPSSIVDDVTVIIDAEKKYSFPILDSTLNYMFCKALNKLNDENEQLKSENKQLKERLRVKVSEEQIEQLLWDRKRKDYG